MTPELAPFQQAVLVRNNVPVRGSAARTLVYAHGFGCDQNMWRFVAPAFEHDHRVVLFDYVGSGHSDLAAFDRTRYASLDGYAQDLIEIGTALALDGAVLVAHSVSAMIGVLAALRAPRLFSQLLMIGPSPRYINDPPEYHGGFERSDLEGLLSVMDHNYIGWAQALAPMVMANPGRPGLAQELEQSFCSTDPEAARLFARATFFADNRADLARFTLPSLILQVSDDAIAPRAVCEYLHRSPPRITLHVLAARGLGPHMSHPSAPIAALRGYLELPVAA
jgi:sigma-B regulation protein RsbQ